MGVLQYSVRLATQRLVQWQCAHLAGWVPGVGMIPRLWRTADGVLQPQEGLTTLEAGQKRTWQQMMSGASSSRNSRSDFTDAALQSAYEAPWMRPSQLRQHPLQRAADAAAVLTAQRQQQLAAPAVAGPAHNDLADPLTGLQQQPEEEAPWKAAYGRLALQRLPKTLKVFGWRLLHNGLWVGARKMHFFFFFLGGASYMDGSHELSDPRVRAEAPGNLADRSSPWAQLRPHGATAVGRQARLASTGPCSSPPQSKVWHMRPISNCS